MRGSGFEKTKSKRFIVKKQECRDNKVTVYTSNYLPNYQTSNITSRGLETNWKAGLDDCNNNFKLPMLYAIVGGVSQSALDQRRRTVSGLSE
jgi:hypothetical protein